MNLFFKQQVMLWLRTLGKNIFFAFGLETLISQSHFRVVRIRGIYNATTLAINTRLRQDR
jgi:hypothetical protein